MLRYLPFLLSLLMWIACKPKTSERIERYENGQIKSRVALVDGKMQGLMTDYFSDGKVKGERWFKDDQQVGKSIFYYPQGQIREVQYYENGTKVGGDTLWYENGQVEFTVEMEAGKKNGYLRKWSPEGVPVYNARYEMDTLVEVKGELLQTRRNPGALDTGRLNVPAN